MPIEVLAINDDPDRVAFFADWAIDLYPEAAADYRAGRHQALGPMIGFANVASAHTLSIGKIREALIERLG